MAQKTLKIPEDFWTSNAKPCIIEGDTIGEFVMDTDFDITGATIKLQIYRNSRKVFDVETGNGITIVNANQFKIDRVEAVNNMFPQGIHEGDLEFTFPDGEKVTYCRVKYNILKEYTK